MNFTMKDTRNKLLLDAQKILVKKDASGEERTAAHKMIADADLLDEQINLEKRIAEAQAEERSIGRPPRSQPGHESTNDDVAKQKRAFTQWMRSGQISEENRAHLRYAESRDLGVGAVAGSITGGSVLVPVGFDPLLHTAQKSYGALVGAVRNFKTDGGGPIKVATADDTANSLTVIGEATAVSENDPNLGGFISSTDELTTGLIRVSNSLLEDSGFDVDNFIQETFAARYYKGLAKMIQLGNGSNIQAITTGTSIQNSVGGTTTITYKNLVNVFSAIDAAYLEQSSWLMSSTTRANLMSVVDTTGKPLLQADVTGKPFNSLFDRPIVLSAYAQTMAANNIPILFGDLSSYTLRTAGNFSIKRLVERYAELNEVGFIGYCRAGGYNTSQASSPSIVSLQMSAT